MTRAPIVILTTVVLACNPAFAQTSGLGSSTPGMGATSPLQSQFGSAVSPTGIPMGSTELATPGTSPIASPSMFGPTSGNTTCSAMGSPTSQTSTAVFDGGGTAGTASTNCAGAASAAALPSLVLPAQAGSANIPLGSTELGNLGVSSAPSVPMVTISPTGSSTIGGTTPCQTMGSSMSSGSSTEMPIAASGC